MSARPLSLNRNRRAVFLACNPPLDVHGPKGHHFDAQQSLAENMRHARAQNVALSIQPGGNMVNAARSAQKNGNGAASLVALRGTIPVLPDQDLFMEALDGDLLVPISIPVQGHCNRTLYYEEGSTAYLRGSEHLVIDPESHEAIALRLQALLSGAALLGIDNLPSPDALPLYAALQRVAKDASVPLFVDAKGAYLKTILENVLQDTGAPLIGLKQNLEEFANLSGFDPLALSALLASGKQDELLQMILPKTHSIKERYLDPERGLFILTTGSHPWFAFMGNHAYRLTPPQVSVLSPVGSGDTLVGYLMAVLAEKGEIAASDLVQATALSAATATLAGTRIASISEARPYLRTVRLDDISAVLPSQQPLSNANTGFSPLF